MIAVDSSALVAIFLEEAGWRSLAGRLTPEVGSLVSAANYVETGQVLAQRKAGVDPALTIAQFNRMIDELDVSIAAIDEAQARVALDARIRYGRGFGHPARLNYSDCFAYALAKTRNLPLLYVGNDFTHTDIVSALTP